MFKNLKNLNLFKQKNLFTYFYKLSKILKIKNYNYFENFK